MIKKGTITITLASVLAGGTIFTSVLFSYFGSQVATVNRTADIEGDVKVLKNEDININKRFDTVDKRFDTFENNISSRFDSLEELIKAR